jgi:hypothetical protein
MNGFRTGVALAALFAPSLPVLADSTDLEKNTQTVALETTHEFSVHKSNTIAGTDFGQSSRFSLTSYAGKSRELGLSLRNEQLQTTFTQKDASMSVAWTDFTVSYRIFWISPRLSLGSCALKAKAQGVELTDAVCLSAGGGLKGELPFGDRGIAMLDLGVANATDTRDQAGRSVKISSRKDVDFGVSYRVIPYADAVAGMKYRAFSLTIDGSQANEIQTGPYVGLRLGLTF